MKTKNIKPIRNPRIIQHHQKTVQPPGSAADNTVNKDLIKLTYNIQKQRFYFSTGATKNISFRKIQLKLLRKAVSDNIDLILEALKQDLGKSAEEAFTTEIALFFRELDYAVSHLKKWSKPQRAMTPFIFQPASSYIMKEPHGNVLIIGPWNYPFQLVMVPLVSALAAGNTALIKPSEIAPHTSNAVSKILSEIFDPEYVCVVEGGIEVNRFLLSQKFDHIFFTGGTEIGKIVMKAAAEHLTPVTLELGGKSPAIVDADADIDSAARKIIWAKTINAGQTCVAPDYVLVHKSVKGDLVKKMAAHLESFFGKDPRQSPSYGRIINRNHFHRLTSLLRGARLLHGGSYSEDELYIEPTITEVYSMTDPLMKQEIFGPILPVLEFESHDDVIKTVKRAPNPLALYLFTKSASTEKNILERIPSGGAVINDAMIHVANHHLPFGGKGPSGMGSYHGIYGFRAFSRERSVMKQKFTADILFRYPPLKITLKWLRRLFG
jgi:acyl-CoA reductase-like NAD-dependent aldehyde dehydrogenase